MTTEEVQKRDVARLGQTNSISTEQLKHIIAHP